ncbi:DNA damage-inducible protein F [BD1-7 clade bacterium]|uniref:DNA damage-inducible protein F n=1 Tax=BD1-7 clade bacterium TaxID=2029982 RepID=A0A5S9N189_9GAMM|nr:DNA damage-inducible protein F [BD1-7 clade bacterium]CAA0083507.1 DNA damage-inducible protein F [BD1-7 clade bacterium]
MLKSRLSVNPFDRTVGNLPVVNLYARIWALSWPLILSNLSVPLLGMVDTAMLGHLESPVYLGAVALGASFVSLFLASTNFLRMSTTGLSAQAFGRHDQTAALNVFRQSTLLALLIGAALALFSPLLAKLGLTLMLDTAAASTLSTYAQSYIGIRLWGAPATLMNFVIVGWAVGQQNSKLALISLTTTALLNIAFDGVFILALGMHSEGAAIATALAEYASLGISCIYLYVRYPWWRNVWRPQATSQKLSALLRLNGDFFIRSLCLLGVFAFFNRASAGLGETALAANAILLQIVLLQSYALDGFANATEALIGAAAGKKHPHYRPVLKATAIASVIAAVVLMLLLGISSPLLASLFTHHATVIDAVNYLLPAMIVLPLIAVWAYWLDGVAIGFTASRAMRNSSLICSFVVFLPIWWSTQAFGNNGLWASFFAFTLARGVVLASLLFVDRRQLLAH